MKRVERLLLAVLLAGLGAQVLWAWPWSRDLVVQIFIRPQQQLFAPPPGAVAVGSEAQLAREAAARSLRSPLAASEETLKQGRQLFETYCLVCHGPEGRGNGPVAGGAMLPADLTSARVQALSDGALYHTLRHGFGTMPAYYDRLTSEERWRVILYVRTLGGGKQP